MANRLTKSLSNNTTTNYLYDDASRLLTLDNQANATSFAKFDYAYNAVNNRVSRSETDSGAPTSTDSYDYDATDQVTQVKYNVNPGSNTQDRLVNYAYDAAGNRVAVTDGGVATSYTANNLNQYTSVGIDHPTYDPNGNLTSQANGNYSYDAQNRLVSASSSTSAINFSYDARNRCVSRSVNGVTTYSYYDGWNLIEEHSSSDALLARYVHGANVDELLARIMPPATTYYHYDALGSAVALTDANSNLLEKYTYDIYGAPTIKNSANVTVATSTVGNRFLFAGREYIQEIGLYDLSHVKMPNLNKYLTPKRRVILAWELIILALLCQAIGGMSPIVNIFILFAAGAFHEILVERLPRFEWESPLLKVVCGCFFVIFFCFGVFSTIPIAEAAVCDLRPSCGVSCMGTYRRH